MTRPSNGSSITAEAIAQRLERYLVQHPYISTLTINLFNPGQASLLAKALALLQERPELKSLRYDIRLFVAAPEAFGVGEDLEQLLSNSNQLDGFTTSIGNPLFPKFNLAIHSIESFRQSPMAYQAHLAILIDLFPAKELGVSLPLPNNNCAPLHGLIQEFTIKFQDDESGTYWQRQPSHGQAAPLEQDSSLTSLLTQLPQQISGAIATVATGEVAFDQQPVITLGLDIHQREIINIIHQACDWVFTIDRNLGIEFFDRGGQQRPPYLVDYTPDSSASLGHRLVITSRSLTELKTTLAKVLQQYHLPFEPFNLAAILEYLRSLSGRLALKLLSTSQHQAEVLGLALARQFLQHQGALSNQIIVPLDAHTNLFRTTQQRARELEQNASLQRTDLALFDLNLASRTIRCNLVEVKCYTNVGSLGNFNRLKEAIAEQIQQSEDVLRQHFEDCQQAGRLLKTYAFSTLISFYLERSLRYQLINEEAAAEARAFLATLEHGYELRFTHSGLIFDFEKPGTEPPVYEQGTEYHRIGIDLIKDLITTAKLSPEANTAQTTIPQLLQAAFLVPDRERSASSE